MPTLRGATSTPVPISLLHEDILWRIFLQNTETQNDKRLTTARYTSQVCQRWRTIMLRTSSIWGRLIDLEHLQRNTYDWIQEVISRAGNAFLWITGSISIRPNSLIFDFFLPFISQNWVRIQRFSVSETTPGLQRMNYWITLFKQPAPNLVEFDFRYSASFDAEPWILPSPLFQSSAPALSTFRVYRTRISSGTYDNKIKFTKDMPTSWFSTLRSFSLHQHYSLTVLFKILSTLPLLEDLKLHGYSDLFADPLTRDNTVVQIPRLSILCLEDWGFADIKPFLDLITPSKCCWLSILNPTYPSTGSIDQEMHKMILLEGVIKHYVQTYFNCHPARKISLSIHSQHIELQDLSSMRHNIPILPSISIYRRDEDNSSLVQMLFNTALFASVRELHLRNFSSLTTTEYYKMSGAIPVWESRTVPFLDPLVDYILSKDIAKSPFPNLEILKIGDDKIGLITGYQEVLYLLLKSRWSSGQPISVLDLTAIPPNRLYSDLYDLEGFMGLAVKWASPKSEGVVNTYICGSGSPEQLRFKEGRMWKHTEGFPSTRTTPTWGIGFQQHPHGPLITHRRQGWSGQT